MGQTLKDAFLKWPHCAATYAGLGLLVALLFFRSTPPIQPVERFSVDEPFLAAGAHAGRVGGRVFTVSYTGSMKPFLMGGECVVVVASYPEIRKGDVLIYNGELNPFAKAQTIIHRAVQKDSGGWIMSGDANAHTETWSRVRPDNYLGTVVAIYQKKQTP